LEDHKFHESPINVARSIDTTDRHYSFHALQLTVWCAACAKLVWKLCSVGLVAAGSAEHEAPAAAPPTSCTKNTLHEEIRSD